MCRHCSPCHLSLSHTRCHPSLLFSPSDHSAGEMCGHSSDSDRGLTSLFLTGSRCRAALEALYVCVSQQVCSSPRCLVLWLAAPPAPPPLFFFLSVSSIAECTLGNDDCPPPLHILSLIDLSMPPPPPPPLYLSPVCVLGNDAAGPLKAGHYLTAPHTFHSLQPPPPSHTHTYMLTQTLKGPK